MTQSWFSRVVAGVVCGNIGATELWSNITSGDIFATEAFTISVCGYNFAFELFTKLSSPSIDRHVADLLVVTVVSNLFYR